MAGFVGKLGGVLPKEAMQRARRVLWSIRATPLSDVSLIDVSDRVALLTVVVGLRDVAAFGFGGQDNGPQLTGMGKIIDSHGLHCLVTPFIRDRTINESLKDVVGNLSEVFKRVDADSDAKNPGRLLWVCRNPAKFDEIRAAVDGKVDAGVLLEYPPCCIERHQDSLVRSQRAFATAIVRAVGNDATAVERALREDLEVHIPDEEQVFDNSNVPSTHEHFPFVFHVACDACIASDQSPTAQKNRDYEAAVLQFDRTFHHLFTEMVRIYAEIHRIGDEAEAHGIASDWLDQSTNERLQKLIGDAERIHRRILNA